MRFTIYDWRFAVCAVLFFLAPSSFAQPSASEPNETGTNVYLIDLPVTLRLAGAQNLDVQIAREKLAEATASNDSALLHFFPWLNAGIAYSRHDNRIQDSTGNILEVNKQAYAPGGALVSQLDLGDAIYKKLAARQLERAAGYALEAQRQEIGRAHV